MRLNPGNRKELFNYFDDRALIAGFERREIESNILLHNRVVNREEGNSTKNGLSQWILDAFEEDQENYVEESYVFTSTYVPLSYAQYNELIAPDVSYVSPSVYDYTLDETLSFDYSDSWNDYEKDISDTVSGRNWTIYKEPSGEYGTIWVSSYAADEVRFNYQTIIDGEIYDIEESPRRDHE